ncbi:MAG: N-ethylammeline chlorohydrolase [Spirochaetae bacterium HGW-Spirochaetae-3]|jgi:5-methylthioadenosine/S-adenosylhomocysteine deaminase|nr:MAG: N-ethylammeline chlorohydrolase [Spirochaetae bacterium HGW-Spirochaetae-3]
MNTIIRNGIILAMDSPEPELVQGDIGIEGSTIAFVGARPAAFKADREIDASGSVVMPGLVNAHTHIAMSLMRHYADDLPFWDWLFDRIIPVEEKLTDGFVYDGSMLSLVEMIRGGVTCFADMYSNMDAVASATLKSGLRANLTRGLVFNSPADEVKLDEARRFHAEWHGRGAGRIRVDVGPHAVYTCAPVYLEKAIRLSEDLGTRIHMHLSESRKEVADCVAAYGKSPIAHVRDVGLFTRKTYGAHCVHIDEDDIRILKDNGVAVVNNPASNMKLGNGFAPVAKLLEAGVTVALGTDGSASNNNLNMFEEMNTAALVNKGITEDPTAVSAYAALKMATINGARALGLDDAIGSLRAGKKADIILVDMEAPHFYPRNSVAAALVYAAQGSDVKTVICDGEVLMEDRRMTRLDVGAICAKAQESAALMTGNADFIA